LDPWLPIITHCLVHINARVISHAGPITERMVRLQTLRVVRMNSATPTRASSARMAWLTADFVTPSTAMLLILVLFLAIGPFRRTLDAVPQPWLVGAQIGRLVGFLVLSFGLAGTIPMSFAGPAGWGDGISGLFAPIVAFMLYRRVPGAALAALIWNAWGLGDLINVARLASLTTPGTSAFDPGLGDNSNFSLFPTGLLQVLYGPLYILLHVFSIRALVRRALGRDTGVEGVPQNV
jgi:hypothetical protein